MSDMVVPEGYETWQAVDDSPVSVVAVSYESDGTCHMSRGAMEFLLTRAGYVLTTPDSTADPGESQGLADLEPTANEETA